METSSEIVYHSFPSSIFLPPSLQAFFEKPFSFFLETKFFSLNSECFLLRHLKLKSDVGMKSELNKRVEGRIAKSKRKKAGSEMVEI